MMKKKGTTMTKKINKKDPAGEAESKTKTPNKSLTKKQNNVKVIIPLRDLVQAFIEAGEKIKEFEALMEPYKAVKDELKLKIIETFKDRGEFSSRIEGATVSLSVRKTAVVVNQIEVMNALKQGGLDSYIVETLSPEFDEYRKAIAKGEAIKLPGIEVRETEFVSVRKNDKVDPRKLTTNEFVKLGDKKNV